MHYAISYHLAQARIDGLRRHARRATLTRAARGPQAVHPRAEAGARYPAERAPRATESRHGTPRPTTCATRTEGKRR